MSEYLSQSQYDTAGATTSDFAEQHVVGTMGKVTVLEALAEEIDGVAINRSNQTTPPAADADDQ